MTKLNSEIRQEAMAKLKGNWGKAATFGFITILLMLLVQSVSMIIFGLPEEGEVNLKATLIDSLGQLLILPVFVYGAYVAFLNFNRGEDIEISALFEGFKDYTRIVFTYLLMSLYIGLWMLLLIVPGMIKAYSYAMTLYVLKDNPELSYNAAIERSMAMMKGNKMRLFLLSMNIVMWVILSFLTLGIALCWVLPYSYACVAVFYEEVKAEYEAKANYVEVENKVNNQNEMLGSDSCCGSEE